MNTIVAVYWEGRTYEADSWLKDWEVLKQAFGNDPVFATPCGFVRPLP